MSFFRPNIVQMSGYEPGEQPAAGTTVFKLNTNENPYPPSPKAVEIMRNFDPEQLRRYPNPMGEPARSAAAKAWSVPVDWILVGNGSDDLLTMLFRACAGPGRTVVCPTPTYTLYRTLADIQEASFAAVPFDDEYNLPVDKLAQADGALTLIANPNSPSGTFAPLDKLGELASRLTGVLAIDEAYVDFAQADATELAREYDNVIVLRTLSKGFSMAGLRLGFGIANPALLEGLIKVKDSYNVDALSAAVGAAALDDQDHKNACVDKVIAERKVVVGELEVMGFSVLPSEANFILARPASTKAASLYNALKDRGILVRYFDNDQLADKLRITIGTPQQNAALIAALKEIMQA